MHLQVTCDHPIVCNGIAKIPERPRIPSSVVVPDDNHQERMT